MHQCINGNLYRGLTPLPGLFFGFLPLSLYEFRLSIHQFIDTIFLFLILIPTKYTHSHVYIYITTIIFSGNNSVLHLPLFSLSLQENYKREDGKRNDLVVLAKSSGGCAQKFITSPVIMSFMGFTSRL